VTDLYKKKNIYRRGNKVDHRFCCVWVLDKDSEIFCFRRTNLYASTSSSLTSSQIIDTHLKSWTRVPWYSVYLPYKY
jgi:hypothetical protein